jgi:hypothetical protein
VTRPKLSEKVRIVLVHGMSSKPAEPDLLALWGRALLANLAIEAGPASDRITRDDRLLTCAYWADAVPDHLPDPPSAVKDMRRCIDRVLRKRRSLGRRLHVDGSGWTQGRVRTFGKDVIEALSTSLRIRPEMFREHLWELERYHEDSGIADRIRRPLEECLRECWDTGLRVIAIAHSLGAAVAYDALWRFSHREDPEFRRYRHKRVDLLVTLGTPLADPTIQNVMMSGRWLAQRHTGDRTTRRRAWLGNVDRWDNYSAIADYVCHDLDMEKEFFAGMRRDLPHLEDDALNDFPGLFNPYREPDGTPNPHKIFGYLIQPMLATRLVRLLRQIDRQ